MDSPDRLVTRFYDDVWNRWDDRALLEVLAEDVEFRGSLGDEVVGRSGFREYRERVRSAAPDFHNQVVDLVTGIDRAAARIVCSGHQRGELLGIPATGRRFAYAGAAFFRIAAGRLGKIWVLGDLDGLRRQLTAS